MNTLLKGCGAVALLSLAALFIQLTLAARTLEAQTTLLVTQTTAELDAANHQLEEANDDAGRAMVDITNLLTKMVADFDKQITEANRQIALTRTGLQGSVETLVQTSAETLRHTTQTLDSVNQVIADKDIPKLIRDTRQTMAIAGSAASHIESTANSIAHVAPSIGASIESTAKSADGIAADVHEVADSIVHPKKKRWYQRVGSVLEEFAARVLGYAI